VGLKLKVDTDDEDEVKFQTNPSGIEAIYTNRAHALSPAGSCAGAAAAAAQRQHQGLGSVRFLSSLDNTALGNLAFLAIINTWIGFRCCVG